MTRSIARAVLLAFALLASTPAAAQELPVGQGAGRI